MGTQTFHFAAYGRHKFFVGRGGEITLNWSGTLKGDEIAFTRMAEGGQGQAQEFTLKRQQ